jgi:hypothetical protein
MVVALALDELVHITLPEPEKRSQLDDGQLREAPGCVVANPTLGNAEELCYGARAQQKGNWRSGRDRLQVGLHKGLAFVGL